MPTVTTPAKQLVEVLPDDDYVELSGATRKALNYRWEESKRPVLGALWRHGTYKDASGFATAKLYKDAAKLGYTGTPQALTMLIRDPNNVKNRTHNGLDVAIEREHRGKRTYSIALAALPEAWFAKLDAEWPHMNGHTSVTKAPDVPTEAPPDVVAHTVEPPPIVESDPEMGAVVPYLHLPEGVEATAMVAMALLSQVVEIARRGTYTPQAEAQLLALKSSLDDTQRNLASRLDENTRLRTRLQEAGEQISALQFECDGLRQRANRLESNLQAAINSDASKWVNGRIQDELRKLMEAKPITKGA